MKKKCYDIYRVYYNDRTSQEYIESVQGIKNMKRRIHELTLASWNEPYFYLYKEI